MGLLGIYPPIGLIFYVFHVKKQKVVTIFLLLISPPYQIPGYATFDSLTSSRERLTFLVSIAILEEESKFAIVFVQLLLAGIFKQAKVSFPCDNMGEWVVLAAG